MSLVAANLNSNKLTFEPNDRIIHLNTITNKSAIINYKQGKQTINTILKAFMDYQVYRYFDINTTEFITDHTKFDIMVNDKLLSYEMKDDPTILDTYAEQYKSLNITYRYKPSAVYSKLASQESTSFGPNKLQVKTLTGKNLTIDCDITYDTVALFKAYISMSEGIPEDQQRIIYEGRQLEDNKLLSSYNIKNDDTLHLVLRLRGGMYREESGRSGNYMELDDVFFTLL